MNAAKNPGHCPNCRKEMFEIVRMFKTRLHDEEENHIRETKNIARICSNPACTLYVDIEKVKTWERRT